MIGLYFYTKVNFPFIQNMEENGEAMEIFYNVVLSCGDFYITIAEIIFIFSIYKGSLTR